MPDLFFTSYENVLQYQRKNKKINNIFLAFAIKEKNKRKEN